MQVMFPNGCTVTTPCCMYKSMGSTTGKYSDCNACPAYVPNIRTKEPETKIDKKKCGHNAQKRRKGRFLYCSVCDKFLGKL